MDATPARSPFLTVEPPVLVVHLVVSTLLAVLFTSAEVQRLPGLTPGAVGAVFLGLFVWWLVPSLLGHGGGRASTAVRVLLAAPIAALAMLLVGIAENGPITSWTYWNLPIVAAWTVLLRSSVVDRPARPTTRRGPPSGDAPRTSPSF